MEMTSRMSRWVGVPGNLDAGLGPEIRFDVLPD